MTDTPRDPDTLRDTVPIRPLRPWASRLLVTLALIAAGALGVLAARLMGDMASDPSVRERFEAVESMRSGREAAAPVDTAAVDTTSTQDQEHERRDSTIRESRAVTPGTLKGSTGPEPTSPPGFTP